MKGISRQIRRATKKARYYNGIMQMQRRKMDAKIKDFNNAPQGKRHGFYVLWLAEYEVFKDASFAFDIWSSEIKRLQALA